MYKPGKQCMAKALLWQGLCANLCQCLNVVSFAASVLPATEAPPFLEKGARHHTHTSTRTSACEEFCGAQCEEFLFWCGAGSGREYKLTNSKPASSFNQLGLHILEVYRVSCSEHLTLSPKEYMRPSVLFCSGTRFIRKRWSYLSFGLHRILPGPTRWIKRQISASPPREGATKLRRSALNPKSSI